MSGLVDSKKYSEREVSAILRRAAEIQSHSADESSAEGEVTLERLTQAAEEIGIDPAAVQQAAAELLEAQTKRSGKRSGFGVTWDIDETALVKGDITPQTWPQLLEELRDVTGRVGIPAVNGDAFEWLSRSPDPLHVSFIPVDGSIRIRIKSKLADWAALSYIFPPGAAIFLTLIVTAVLSRHQAINPAAFIAAIVGGPALAMLAGRAAFRRLATRRKLAVNALMHRVRTAIAKKQPAAVEVQAVEPVERIYAASSAPARTTSYSSPVNVEEDQVLRQGNGNG